MLGSRLKDPTFVESYVQPTNRSYPSYSGYLCRGSNLMLCRFSGSFKSGRLSGTNLARGRVMGLLVANHCSSPRQWQQLEIDLLKQLATQVAIAIQQSTLEQAQTELNERKQAEQKIREQAALLDVATDAILVQDLENKILFWNKGAERLVRLEQEAKGKSANELLSRDTLPKPKLPKYHIEGAQGSYIKSRNQAKKLLSKAAGHLCANRRKNQNQSSSLILTSPRNNSAQFLRERLESLGTLLAASPMT